MSSGDMRVVPVILSGGSGTRLWPVSSDEKPKQFLNLTGPRSMFQLTLDRCVDTEFFRNPLIVGGTRHADLMEQQLRESGQNTNAIILEPCARNTAPAIALAALACENPEDLMLVMPSDHVIANNDLFRKAIEQSVAHAHESWLVTFGIEPTGPETGYGYIKQGDAIPGANGSFSVEKFVEKPDLANAQSMLSQGGFHWNAGIFMFRADSYLAALEEFAPEMLSAATDAMNAADRQDSFVTPDETKFALAPSDSIDYAVMEKANKVAVTPMNPGWSDVGSWDSLYDISKKDDAQNAVSGSVSISESRNNMVHAGDLEIAIKGVDDLIVVAEGKTVMILPKGKSQDVKQIANEHKNSSQS